MGLTFYIYGCLIALLLSYTIIKYCDLPKVKQLKENVPEDTIVFYWFILSTLSWFAVILSIYDMILLALYKINKK